jgi:hypothetical protein
MTVSVNIRGICTRTHTGDCELLTERSDKTYVTVQARRIRTFTVCFSKNMSWYSELTAFVFHLMPLWTCAYICLNIHLTFHAKDSSVGRNL